MRGTNPLKALGDELGQLRRLENDRLWPSGYSYLYFRRGAGGSDTLEGTSYYYPLATRSVYVTLDVTF